MARNQSKPNRAQPVPQPRKSTPESSPKPANQSEWAEMGGNEREIQKSDRTEAMDNSDMALPLWAAHHSLK